MAISLDLGNLLVHLKLGKGEWDTALKEVERTLDRTARKLETFGRQMSLKVTAPLVAVGTVGVKAFASFDDAMTKSLAIMDNVTPKMRKQMEGIALGLSKDTTSSATKVAQGYKFLASAGYDAAQSMAAIGAVNKFAIAGNFDLARSTTYIADSMSALGMKVDDARQNMLNMTHISDVLVKANIIANAETEQFAASLTNEAGAAMKNWNINLEEGVAVLAAYADQGIKAEEAGTLFGRMLRLMMSGFESNREAWQAMNMNIYDTQGNLKPLADIIEMLTKEMEGMSAETKVVALDMLGFEARSQQAILPLLGATDRIRKYTEQLRVAGGVTDKVARENMSSFIDQLKILWNNVVAVGIEIGSILAPTILTLNDYIRAGLQHWERLNDSTKTQVVQFGLVAAAIGPMSLGLSIAIRMFQDMTKVVAVLTATMFSWAGVAVLVAGLAYTLYAAWNQNFIDIKSRMQEWFDAFKQGYDWLANTAVGPFLKNLVGAFGDAFRTIRSGWSDFLADLASTMIGAGRWMKIMMSSVREGFGKINFSDMVTELKEGLKQANTEFAEGFVSAFDTYKPETDKLRDYSVKAWETAGVHLRAFGQAEAEHMGGLMAAVKTQFKSDLLGISELLQGALFNSSGSESNAFGGMFGGVLEKAKAAGSFLVWPFQEVYRQLTKTEPVIARTISDLEKLKKSAMSEEAIRSAWDRLYAGLNQRSDQYFQFQQKKLTTELDLWEANAAAIAKQFDVEKQYVLDLIEAYKKEQQVLLDIERLKTSDSIANGFKAAGMQIRREIQTWGERAYEFTMSMSQSLENGLMNMLQDTRNWADAMKSMLKEIYFEAIRIAFISPLAKGMAGAFSTIGSAVVGGLFPGPASSNMQVPGINPNQVVDLGSTLNFGSAGSNMMFPGHAEGGMAWTPHIAKIAENEPELITPLSKLGGLGGKVTVNVINQSGVPLGPTKEEQYMMSDERIINVVVSRMDTDSRLQKAVGTRR